MSTLEKAIELATKVHFGQKDKAGQPYILHPLRLMFKFETEVEMMVAVMHDVVEDGDLSLEFLKDQGFSSEVVEAIDSLTKRRDESYEIFISRVSKNKLAKKVKIEDIKDNMNLVRLRNVDDEDLRRVGKYHKALKVLGLWSK